MRLTLNLNDRPLVGFEITKFGVTYDLLGWYIFIGPDPTVGRAH